MSIAGVTRELLVRYLETWVPGTLHAARRATFVQAWASSADADAAEAGLRVFGEFSDRLRGRRLSTVFIGPETGDLAARLAAVQAELGAPPELSVHTVAGGDEALPAALSAAGARGSPLLACLDTDRPAPLRADAGRPTELLLTAPAGHWPDRRADLHEAGFPLTAGVELVDRAEVRLLAFATGSMKNLEAFKNSLWAVDEYAGVRYRDPHDPEHDLLDISLRPRPGPLRRQLLAHLAQTGECSVTQLRHFALTETAFRASDAVGVLTALLSAGTVTRTPERGRLSGDVLIRPAGPASPYPASPPPASPPPAPPSLAP